MKVKGVDLLTMGMIQNCCPHDVLDRFSDYRTHPVLSMCCPKVVSGQRKEIEFHNCASCWKNALTREYEVEDYPSDQ